MEMLTRVACTGCQRLYRLNAFPSAPGYFLARCACATDSCRVKPVVIVFHVAVVPKLRVRVVRVLPDAGRELNHLARRLFTIRRAIRDCPDLPEMTRSDVEVMLAIASLAVRAEPPESGLEGDEAEVPG